MPFGALWLQVITMRVNDAELHIFTLVFSLSILTLLVFIYTFGCPNGLFGFKTVGVLSQPSACLDDRFWPSF